MKEQQPEQGKKIVPKPDPDLRTPAHAFNAGIEILKRRYQRKIKRQGIEGDQFMAETERLGELGDYLKRVGYDPRNFRDVNHLKQVQERIQENMISDRVIDKQCRADAKQHKTIDSKND